MPKKKQAIWIPPEIKEAFDAYGFDENVKLENAVSTRRDDEWFAILFPDSDDGPFSAIDFRQTMEGWEVQNDYVGPFDTIKEFDTEKLTLRFI